MDIETAITTLKGMISGNKPQNEALRIAIAALEKELTK